MRVARRHGASNDSDERRLGSDEMSWPALKERISQCRDCQVADCGRPLFMQGDPTGARVLFVMEAPNREDTVDPTKGYISISPDTDPSGKFFCECFDAELPGERLAVINSVLCLPPGGGGNYPVRRVHRENCSKHLRAQIDLIDPAVVATVGGEPLRAVGLIEKHRLPGVTRAAGKPVPWYGRTLFPLGHTSHRGRLPVNRSEALQREDWRKLGQLVADL